MRIEWVSDRVAFDQFLASVKREIDAVDPWIASMPEFTGYCTACRALRRFTVFGGAYFGRGPNLREGMVCEGCFMSNRQRPMLAAAEETWCRDDVHLLLMEGLTALTPAITARFRSVVAREFVAPDAVGGWGYERRGRQVRHEDATRLSFASGALDGVIHNDMLEHVPDYRGVRAEALRVLKAGGSLLFTCPFFPSRDSHLVRAMIEAGGVVRHIEPPEVHGDPLDDGGILAYYHFGWSILDDMRAAGFCRVELGVTYDPLCGFTGNAYPDRYGFMLPTVFRGSKV